MIEFLATEKKYDNAVIIYIFFQWWQKKDKQAKMLGVLGGIISILIFGLIGFLPLATFFWSLIRNYL